MPSPAIATLRPSACSRLEWPRPSGRASTSAITSSIPSWLRHGLGGRAAVAGQHHDAQALVVQAAHRLGRGLLDRIGHAEESGGLAVHGHEHDRLALRAQCSARSAQSGPRRSSSLVQQRAGCPERPCARRRCPARPCRSGTGSPSAVRELRRRAPRRRQRSAAASGCSLPALQRRRQAAARRPRSQPARGLRP